MTTAFRYPSWPAAFLVVTVVLLNGCGKKTPARLTATSSVVGYWRSTQSLSPGEMVMPGDRFMQNFQITFYKNGTFSESGGLPMQGTWVQSGHLVTIREDRLSLGDKSFSLGKGVTTSDLQVSGDGKTLSGLGRDRIKYSRD